MYIYVYIAKMYSLRMSATMVTYYTVWEYLTFSGLSRILPECLNYNGTRVMWTPLGPTQSVLIRGVS